MVEINLSMADFDLSGDRGTLKNKEDKRVHIEKLNAKASIIIAAAKKLKKESSTQKDIDSYVEQAKAAMANPPIEASLQVLDSVIDNLQKSYDKLIAKKDKYMGKLGRSDQNTLEKLTAELERAKQNKADFIAEHGDQSSTEPNAESEKESPENEPDKEEVRLIKYEDMTKADLSDVAFSRDIDIPHNATKADIIKLINDREQEQ